MKVKLVQNIVLEQLIDGRSQVDRRKEDWVSGTILVHKLSIYASVCRIRALENKVPFLSTEQVQYGEQQCELVWLHSSTLALFSKDFITVIIIQLLPLVLPQIIFLLHVYNWNVWKNLNAKFVTVFQML